MVSLIHAYARALTYAHIVYMHTNVHTHMCIHTYIHTYSTCIHIHSTCTHTHTYGHTHTHMHTHAYLHTRSTCIHVHIHIHIHIHIHRSQGTVRVDQRIAPRSSKAREHFAPKSKSPSEMQPTTFHKVSVQTEALPIQQTI